MRTRPGGLRFIFLSFVVSLAVAWAVHGVEVERSFTGTGANGSIAWGKFTTGDTAFVPNYFAPGGIYQTFFLTISNIPGNGPDVCIYLKTELDASWFSTDSDGVSSILPLGGHSFGPPEENHYDLSGGENPHQCILTYNASFRDTITWSGLTITPPPPPLPVLSFETGNPDSMALLWATNAVGF